MPEEADNTGAAGAALHKFAVVHTAEGLLHTPAVAHLTGVPPRTLAAGRSAEAPGMPAEKPVVAGRLTAEPMAFGQAVVRVLPLAQLEFSPRLRNPGTLYTREAPRARIAGISRKTSLYYSTALLLLCRPEAYEGKHTAG